MLGREKMEIHELIFEMKLLERRLTLYEEKYGVLSEDLYTRRKEAYTKQIKQHELAETLRVQPAY